MICLNGIEAPITGGVIRDLQVLRGQNRNIFPERFCDGKGRHDVNTKPQQKQRRGVVQISEVANGLIDPVLAKRAGINTMLLGSWDEIAGAEFAECTRPERIAWPRRASAEGIMTFVPGTVPDTLDDLPAWLATARVVPTEELEAL